MLTSRLLGFLLPFLAIAAVALAATGAHAGEDREKEPLGPSRSVILIIGDGMDDQQITIARNYLQGARGRLLLDQMPVRGISQVLTVSDEDPDTPVYVADSANSATSIATGAVTSRGRIATSAKTDQDLATIVELAEAAGLRTGLVTTASVTDATPAAFVAHVSLRLCESPTMMENIEYRGIALGGCPADTKANGGEGSISEQLASSGVDVLLGGGSKHFEPAAEGQQKTVHELATDNGFRLIRSAEELRMGPRGGKLLGLFSESTMPVRLRGEAGRVAEEPSPSLLNQLHWYLGDVELPLPMKCEPNPEFEAVPSLKEMTDGALAHLAHENEQGFFLMIESASIDKQAHARNACGSIGELEQLNEALSSALAYAQKNPETLVIVTADHGQAAQILPDESLFAAFGIAVFTPGQLVRIETPEGSIMAVNYATNSFKMEEHTGVAVPLFANEAGRGRIPTMLTHPEIFEVMAAYLGLVAPDDSP